MPIALSGFIVLQNSDVDRYPVVEAIESVAQLCDEIVLLLPDADAFAKQVLREIHHEHLHSFYENSTASHVEQVLFAISQCRGDWLFHLQPDEVLHDEYLPIIRNALDTCAKDVNIDALILSHRHFFGSYRFCHPASKIFYEKEIRLVKKRSNVVPTNDGRTVLRADGMQLVSIEIDAEMYHYACVPPPNRVEIATEFTTLRYPARADADSTSVFVAEAGTSLFRFTGTHPTVMTRRIVHSEIEFQPKEILLERKGNSLIQKFLRACEKL